MSLTVDQFKEHVSTTLGDEAIQRLLDAALESVEAVAGTYDDDGTMSEVLTPRGIGPLLLLARRADSVTSVVEGLTTLASDDYELSPSGFVLRRLDTGTYPSTYWTAEVRVNYLPHTDLSVRDMAQLELARLEIAFTPALVSQTIGSWSETYQQGASYTDQRAQILATLNPTPVGMR